MNRIPSHYEEQYNYMKAKMEDVLSDFIAMPLKARAHSEANKYYYTEERNYICTFPMCSAKAKLIK